MPAEPPSERENVNNTPQIDPVPVKTEDEEVKPTDIGSTSLTNGVNSQYSNTQQDEDSARGRKRKLGELERDKRHRRISPPWKKIEADGPTSFSEGGRRKSGRTNAIPLELTPQGQIRQTRAARSKTIDKKPAGPAISQGASQTAGRKSSRVPNLPAKKPGHDKQALNKRSLNAGTRAANIREHQFHSKGKTSLPRASKWNDASQAATQTHRHRRPSWRALDTDETPTRSSKRQAAAPTKRRAPDEARVQSLRLNYRRPLTSLPLLHPLNLIQPHKRKHGSLAEFLAHDDPLEGDDEHRLSHAEVLKEVQIRDRLEKSIEPGGALAGINSEAAIHDHSQEPRLGYTHLDYLLPHIQDFAPRLARERKVHADLARKTARLCASAFESTWRLKLRKTYASGVPGVPKTDAELQEEAARAKEEQTAALRRRYIAIFRRTALKEITNIWSYYGAQARQEKVAEYEKREADLGKQTLNAMLERSSRLLQQRIQGSEGAEDEDIEGDSELASLANGTSEGGYTEEEGTDDDDDDEDDDADDDSDSDSSSGSDVENDILTDGVVPDDQLTLEQLRERYANIDSIDTEKNEKSTARSEIESPKAEDLFAQDDSKLSADQLREKYAMLSSIDLDEALAGRETVSDSDDDDDDKSTSSGTEDDMSGEEVEGEEDEELDMSASLLGFLPPEDLAALQELGSETETDQHDAVDDLSATPQDAAPQEGIADLGNTAKSSEQVRKFHEMHSGSDASAQMTPITDVAAAPSSKSSVEPSEPAFRHVPVEGKDLNLKTPLPHLLRGTLRQYQHYGLDWLAGMYMSGTNGILADEMGLGKTIQTIALLAHLATEHEIWGPHLIIVPTSVMLNWEMEFKKWCPGFKILTYYGTQEERKQKRQGWLDHDKWNVCITSYQLALQDAYSLKRKPWYYMVLDEAHHIKNFQSQRWQTLLAFPTDRRLLLTGTPLQNNLTELWSLLCFISHDENKFQDLQDFTRAFRVPAEQILDQGRDSMDEEAWATVKKLHQVLRPHLLRRLKSEVEKQMPKKYEHIVRCRLSKRQRHLYDGYMGLGGTRDSFASGNYMSIIKCLMQLRKVCNHPDLFETRQIVTSFAMPKSATADFEIKELLVRKRFLEAQTNPIAESAMLNLWDTNSPTLNSARAGELAALPQLNIALQRLSKHIKIGTESFNSIDSAIKGLGHTHAASRQRHLHQQLLLTQRRTMRRSVYSSSCLRTVDLDLGLYPMQTRIPKRGTLADLYLNSSDLISDAIKTPLDRFNHLEPIIQKFSCVTPNAVAPDVSSQALTKSGVQAIQTLSGQCTSDPYHESRIRLSIAFPDRGLVQYDCGKLQQLDRLLRQLDAEGHRALIFTQMTKVLDILEQFLNLHGHRYLRLDGSTKIEQRQILTERFNSDSRILAFILSSRSGGLGLNLTGADTVIFYDLDWNPAMDKQCQDRCHRIGQTRDVHIYRFVSEGTIEANILRKSNQKRMLDDVVIQEGEFTTDYFNRIEHKDLLQDNPADAETDAALDMVFGGDRKGREEAEDIEDRDAAKVAEKEVVQTDAADFADTMRGDVSSTTPATPAPTTPAEPPQEPGPDTTQQPDQDMRAEEDTPKGDQVGDLQEYFMRLMRFEYRNFVILPPSARSKKKAKKGKDYGGVRIRR